MNKNMVGGHPPPEGSMHVHIKSIAVHPAAGEIFHQNPQMQPHGGTSWRVRRLPRLPLQIII